MKKQTNTKSVQTEQQKADTLAYIYKPEALLFQMLFLIFVIFVEYYVVHQCMHAVVFL